MILTIVDKLKQAFPDLKLPDHVSVLKISSTQPTYLLFNTKNIHPKYVVKIGTAVDMQHLQEVLEKLFARVPLLIPKPIAVAELRDASWLHIQEGCSGLPWFTLSRHTSEKDQTAIRERSLDVLHNLQIAIARNPEWQKSVHPANELRQELQIMKSTIGCNLSVESQVMQAAELLDKLGTVTSQCQHGDFCLNNLLINGDQIKVIDFEEFGQTSVPLQDELTLAQSFQEIIPTAKGDHLKNSLKYYLTQIIPTQSDFRGQEWPLLIYNLIQRVNQCTGRSGRTIQCRALLSKLDSVLKNRDEFAPGL